MTRPDLLEPFTTRVSMTGGGRADAPAFVASLLEDIARRCADAGSPLIGHIKCYVEAGDARFHCHLTSIRSGARCEGASPADADASPPDADASPADAGALQTDVGAVRMDLAVLVYGLTRETIGVIVSEALGAACAGGATYTLSA